MKLHYYLFTFYESTTEHSRHVSVSMGLPHQRVTQAALNKARVGANAGYNSVPLAVNYLGHMTVEEFNEAEA